MLPIDTPLIFADGTAAYSKLAKTHETHKHGYFILAPSASGKTHFVTQQKTRHWIDGDELWLAALAQPAGAWWLEPIERAEQIEARCDVITLEAKRLGFWIVGGSNTWLKPDAIVIPNWQTQKHHLQQRTQGDNDGGFTNSQLERALIQRKWFNRWAKQGVPKFLSITEAADYLTSSR